jgi:gliding motility-associated-like protein
MPNAFSPNNDSKNDFFRPITQPEKVSFFVLTIFDRWGGKIYETGNSTQGWDGTIKGQPAPQGLYSYTVSYENPAGDQLNIRGLVTLIR